MHRYSLLGWPVDSDFAFDRALPGVEGPAVFRILRVLTLGSGVEFRGSVPGVCEIGVDRDEIQVTPAPGAHPFLVLSAILGPVLGTFLLRRGFLALHASALERDGRVWAFVGPPGAGKSTTLAACLAESDRFVADDLVAIDLTGERPSVLPVIPELRLWPDAVALARSALPAGRQLAPWLAKTGIDMSSRFVDVARPLAGVFLLGESQSRPAVETVAPGKAVTALIRDTWESQLMEGQPDLAREHLDLVSKLISGVSIRRLVRGTGVETSPGHLAEVFDEFVAAVP